MTAIDPDRGAWALVASIYAQAVEDFMTLRQMGMIDSGGNVRWADKRRVRGMDKSDAMTAQYGVESLFRHSEIFGLNREAVMERVLA